MNLFTLVTIFKQALCTNEKNNQRFIILTNCQILKNKRLTPFLDSSTTHSTVSRLMVVTVCRVDNHPSRFLSPAYSILHSYEHKFKNHTCQRSYHFLFISSEIIMCIYINLMQLLFLMLYMCCFFKQL